MDDSTTKTDAQSVEPGLDTGPDSSAVTPMMAQYLGIKQAHPDESHKEWEEPSIQLSTPKIDPTSTSPESRRQRAGGQGKRK